MGSYISQFHIEERGGELYISQFHIEERGGELHLTVSYRGEGWGATSHSFI